MSLDPKQVEELTSNPVFWIIVIYMLKDWLSSRKKKDDEHVTAVKENSREIASLTVAITELKVRLAQVDDHVKLLPKMRADLDTAHERIRILGPQFAQKAPTNS